VNRLVTAVVAGVVAAAALMPLTAAASPTPSPGLNTMLAAPPSTDFVEADKTAPGVVEGDFTGDQYVATGKPSNPSAVKATLQRDGFIAGFGRTWVQRNTQRALVEAVVAFSGGNGAKSWLSASELADKSDPNYSLPVSVAGLDAYYGAHFIYAATSSYVDAVAFVKGNDYFFVVSVSNKDDRGAFTSSQTTAQYIVAPDYSIPPSQWPQPPLVVGGFDTGSLAARVLFFALIGGTVMLALGLVLRVRRRRASPAAVAGRSIPAVRLSPDGEYWWDGQAWRDVAQWIPPAAQRSTDGQYWWDGRTWRPVRDPS
jgi:hypothetical protein